MVHTPNPRTQKMETARTEVQVIFRDTAGQRLAWNMWDPLLKKEKKKEKKRGERGREPRRKLGNPETRIQLRKERGKREIARTLENSNAAKRAFSDN